MLAPSTQLEGGWHRAFQPESLPGGGMPGGPKPRSPLAAWPKPLGPCAPDTHSHSRWTVGRACPWDPHEESTCALAGGHILTRPVPPGSGNTRRPGPIPPPAPLHSGSRGSEAGVSRIWSGLSWARARMAPGIHEGRAGSPPAPRAQDRCELPSADRSARSGPRPVRPLQKPPVSGEERRTRAVSEPGGRVLQLEGCFERQTLSLNLLLSERAGSPGWAARPARPVPQLPDPLRRGALSPARPPPLLQASSARSDPGPSEGRPMTCPHLPEATPLCSGAPVGSFGPFLEGPFLSRPHSQGRTHSKGPAKRTDGRGAGRPPGQWGLGCRWPGTRGRGAERRARLSRGHHPALHLPLPPKERRG